MSRNNERKLKKLLPGCDFSEPFNALYFASIIPVVSEVPFSLMASMVK
jgi:hypothetical protein